MEGRPFFVSIATIAVDLGRVRTIASDLSVAAINAKVIALRAGSHAAGFRPITQFIDQTARAAAELGNEIQLGTQAAARAAVSERRADEALRRLRRARAGADSGGAPSLDAVIERCETARIACSESISRSIRTIEVLLDEIDARVRAISVIAVQSRVEAQQAGTFSVNLEVVAASMSGSAEQIKTIVRQSRRELGNALAARAKHTAELVTL